MLRVPITPRPDWPKRVESKGLLFHSIDGVPYWDESACYLFESAEVDRLEAATLELDRLCLAAVEHVIESGRLGELAIPFEFHDLVAESWERDEHTIYGRFDLAFDGQGPPKLLEYNADTPTALLEAAVIQWFWLQDVRAGVDAPDRDALDQFNSLHERLIEAWRRVRSELGRRVTFATVEAALEDLMTVTYLRDTAAQAGLDTQFLDMAQIGWHAGRRRFTDLAERPIDLLFKLYPWEWMLRERFGRHLAEAPTRWLEPPWKMVLSNKAILPILWELHPGCPYLLPAWLDPPGDTYVVKPIRAREGANVEIVVDGETLAQSAGDYGDEPVIYQAYQPLPTFDGRHAVVGSWIVNGHACGIGVREDDGPITRNTSRFVPHLFRRNTWTKPPAPDWKTAAHRLTDARADASHPLFDRWVDP